MIEFDQKTQEGLHAIDKFVASNLKAFSGAIDELSGMTVGGSAFPELLRVYTVGIAEKKAGDPSPITLMPPICWGPILVAYFHLSIGSPLHLSDDLIFRWAVATGFDACQCFGCGYRFPALVSACNLCGGDQVGIPGTWEERRAARGWTN